LEEEKKKKENQMSQFEVNITLANQLVQKLEALKKVGGKKVVFDLDVIQLFSRVGVKSIPKKVNEIDGTIQYVKDFIAEQQGFAT